MFVLDFFVFLLAVAVVVFIARPLACGFSERLRAAGKPSVEQDALRERVKFLETEVADLKSQLNQMQETTDFLSKCLESGSLIENIEKKKLQ